MVPNVVSALSMMISRSIWRQWQKWMWLPRSRLRSARAAAASEDYDHDAFVAKVSEAAAVRRSAEGAGEPNLGNGVAQESTVTKRNAEDIIMALQQG